MGVGDVVMSKPFLFVDFYKTVSFDYFWSTHQEAKIIGQTLFSADNRALINAWMRGQHRAEDIVQMVAGTTNFPEFELWESLVHSAATLTVFDEALPLIVEAKQKYQVILFTDNFDTFTRFTVPGNPSFYGVFDSIVNSADVGLLKCDEQGKSFLHVAKEEIGNSVLIDDSQSSKETFEALGGMVFQVGTPELTMEAFRSVIGVM